MKRYILTIITFILLGFPGHYVYAVSSSSVAHPRTVPCVPSLPCVSETRQQSGSATRAYLLEDFGTEFMVGFIGLMALISVGFIIYGGLQMHIAMGNEDAIGKAKKTVTWAVGGLVLALLSGAIVTIISRINFD